jgi:hypothetical protein
MSHERITELENQLATALEEIEQLKNPTITLANIPSAIDIGNQLAPALRAASRKTNGPLQRAVLNPIWATIIRMCAEAIMKLIKEWLDKNPANSIHVLADKWDKEMLPEVKQGIQFPDY